jgi:hypothetical protein
VVRLSSAKAATAVRIRSIPLQKNPASLSGIFFAAKILKILQPKNLFFVCAPCQQVDLKQTGRLK